jgi:hypothetical protein
MALAGVTLILLGLLFLAGSAGQGRRVLVGVACLALGAVAAGLGARRYRRAEAVDPARLRSDVLALAEQAGGELSAQQLTAELRWREPAAAPVLETLLHEGSCVRRHERGEVLYVFPALQPRLMQLRCEYCHTAYDLNPGSGGDADLAGGGRLGTCPSCGGPLRREVVAVSLSQGEVYGMDGASEDLGDTAENDREGP